MTAPASDEAQQPRVLVYFGDIEVGAAINKVQTRSAVNNLASAEFMLDLALILDAAIDFFAEVRVVAEHAGTQYPLLKGPARKLRVRCKETPARFSTRPSWAGEITIPCPAR